MRNIIVLFMWFSNHKDQILFTKTSNRNKKSFGFFSKKRNLRINSYELLKKKKKQYEENFYYWFNSLKKKKEFIYITLEYRNWY